LLDASVVSEQAQKKNRTYIQGDKRGEVVDVGLVLAAIAYYDMALLLMRSFDPNYRTVTNWKCNALCAIGQYADAVRWYEEIVRIDSEQNGGTVSGNATTALAKEKMAKYQGRTNAPLSYRTDDLDDFVAPPFTLYAQQCLISLAKGKYADATLYFQQDDRKEYSTKLLKKKWTELVGGADFADLSISLEEHLFEWKGKSRKDEGWCYFSVSGPDFNEGISFVVGRTETGNPAVRRIEFGRP
jgi:tetratricopeptide (TPR) repeat protein